MNHMRSASLVILLALASAPAAEAGPIIYFDTYRSLDVNGTMFENSSAGFWSVFHRDGNTNGSQMTNIGEARIDPQGHPYELIRGSGNLNSARLDAANLSTDLFTSFMLDSPYSASLDAFVSARDAGYAEGYLFDETTQTMLAQVMVETGTARLQYEGILEPGLYSYYLFAQLDTPGTTNDHRASFGGDFELRQFTPVPEPATMSLFGLGLAAVWRKRQRQQAAAMPCDGTRPTRES